MIISPTMNLGELAERMGQITTEDEARAMRDLLVEQHIGETIGDIDAKKFVRMIGQVATREYQIAFVMTDGRFDVVETFEACGNAAANEYAESNYCDREWYVLRDGRNINGGKY